MPVFGLFFSWSFLHEPIRLAQIAGAAAVIFGVVLSSR
jgi:drug/metabolite transporter (DMT)-like permease